MSSKFSGLLSQARNREVEENEDEQQKTTLVVQTQKQEEPQLVTKPEGSSAEVVPAQAPPVESKTTGHSKIAVPPKTKSKPGQAQSRERSKEEDTTTPAQEGVQGGTRGRPANGKSSNPNYTQITAYISKQTHKDMKVALLMEGEGREISELVEELLREWLRTQK